MTLPTEMPKRPRSPGGTLRRYAGVSTPKRTRRSPRATRVHRRRSAARRSGRAPGARRRLYGGVRKRYGRGHKLRRPRWQSIPSGAMLRKAIAGREKGSVTLAYSADSMSYLRSQIPGANGTQMVPYQLPGTCNEWHLDTLLRQHKEGNEDCLFSRFEYPDKATIHGDKATIDSWTIKVTISNQMAIPTVTSQADKYAKDTLSTAKMNSAFILGKPSLSDTNVYLSTICRRYKVKYRVIVYRTRNLPKISAPQNYTGPCSIARASAAPLMGNFNFTDLHRMQNQGHASWVTTGEDAYSVAIPGNATTIDGVAVEGGEADGGQAAGVTAVPGSTVPRKITDHDCECYVERKPFGFNASLQNIHNHYRLFAATTRDEHEATSANPAKARLNRDYVQEVLYDKIHDCTGASNGTDVESTFSVSVGGLTGQQTNHFPGGQRAKVKTIPIRIPKHKLRRPVMFPVDGRNPASFSSNLERYKELDPEWGLPTTAIRDTAAAAQASKYDFRPTEAIQPYLHGILGDPLRDKFCGATLIKEPGTQQGDVRFDYRPINYRWKVAVIPFFVDRDNKKITSQCQAYTYSQATGNWTLGATTDPYLMSFVESTIKWTE